MKKLILIIAALVISTSAFAQANGPIRKGNKCWAATDQRGFGFWDQCADRTPAVLLEEKKHGRDYYDHARTTPTGFGGGGDGGGGGGGGGGK